jgi:outer membrane protein TolC/ABC-type uncharacterized transport system substrate-binding protein
MFTGFLRSIVILACMVGTASGAAQFKLALFQAGDHSLHSSVRESFDQSLRLLLPSDTTYQFQASGFRSAEWNRDSSRIMAKQLVAMKNLDIVVAVGPWVVEDLIEAGFSKPIIALFRTDPYLEGLTDSTYSPLYRNLTVQAVPNKIEADIDLLYRLKPFKKLGLLYFPTGMDSSKLLSRVEAIAKSLGVTAVTAFGHNNIGTYAYLKAYAALPADVDAIYLLPSWGLDSDRVKELATRILADRKTSSCFEGLYGVDKGILISSSGLSHEAESRFAAWKALQIMRGATPQNLPTLIPFSAKLSVNEQTAANLGIDVTLEMTTEADLVKSYQGQPIAMQSLGDVVARAIDLNPGYLAWQDVVSRAEASVAAAKAEYLPKLMLDGSAGYVDDNRLHNERLLTATPELLKNDRYRAGISLELPLFSMETIRATRQAAAETEVRRRGADSAFARLEADVANAYYEALREKAAHGILQRRMQLSNHGAEVARGMVASGEKKRVELTRWKTEELQNRQSLSQNEADIRTASVYLNALMNQPAHSPLLLDSTLLSTDAFWNAYDAIRPYIATEVSRASATERLVNEALAHSPASVQTAQEITLQRMRLGMIGASRYPEVTLRSSFDITDELDSFDGRTEKAGSWTVGAFLHWPLFDSGRRGKQMRVAQSRVSELEYLRDQRSLQTMQLINTLVREIATDAAQSMAAEQENDLATAVLASAMEEYTAGRESFEVTMQTATAVYDAQSRLVNARVRFLDQMYQLVCAIGWSPHRESLPPAILLRRFLAGSK